MIETTPPERGDSSLRTDPRDPPLAGRLEDEDCRVPHVPVGERTFRHGVELQRAGTRKPCLHRPIDRLPRVAALAVQPWQRFYQRAVGFARGATRRTSDRRGRPAFKGCEAHLRHDGVHIAAEHGLDRFVDDPDAGSHIRRVGRRHGSEYAGGVWHVAHRITVKLQPCWIVEDPADAWDREPCVVTAARAAQDRHLVAIIELTKDEERSARADTHVEVVGGHARENMVAGAGGRGRSPRCCRRGWRPCRRCCRCCGRSLGRRCGGSLRRRGGSGPPSGWGIVVPAEACDGDKDDRDRSRMESEPHDGHDLTPENRTRHRVRESVQVRVKGERFEQAEALRG